MGSERRHLNAWASTSGVGPVSQLALLLLFPPIFYRCIYIYIWVLLPLPPNQLQKRKRTGKLPIGSSFHERAITGLGCADERAALDGAGDSGLAGPQRPRGRLQGAPLYYSREHGGGSIGAMSRWDGDSRSSNVIFFRPRSSHYQFVPWDWRAGLARGVLSALLICRWPKTFLGAGLGSFRCLCRVPRLGRYCS
jgi:hypothetical protein